MTTIHHLAIALRLCLHNLRAGNVGHRLRAFVVSGLLACAPAAHGQMPGAVDLSFETGSAVVGVVNVVLPVGNGKTYLGGNFHTVRGAVRNGIARLNADGTADQTFDPGTGVAGVIGYTVNTIAVQADGKVVIGGEFTVYNGTARKRIARLNSDGSLDTSFNPGTGTDLQVHSIAVQADGKVVIGGEFTSYNGTPRNRIARLHSNGSLDTSFNPGTGANDYVFSIAVQADGKVLMGGRFTSYNIEARNRIARLNGDGSLDQSFNPGSGPNQWVVSVAMQADGKVIIGGGFSSYNGVSRLRIARVNSNGSLDTSFDPGAGVRGGLYSVAVQTDGRVLIGGLFSSYNDTPRNGIVRLNSSGSLDTSFDPGTGANSSVLSVAVGTDGKVFIGGYFTSYNKTARNAVARLNSDGTLDMSFIPGTGVNSEVNSVAVGTDGKVLIGGHFTSYNGTARDYMARLNSDGSLDTSFNAPIGGLDPVIGETPVDSVAMQADGRMIIIYDTNYAPGPPRVARLYSDGSVDTSFNPGTGANTSVRSIAVQPDGKALIAGGFTSYNGTGCNYVARINGDGSLDTTFNPAIPQIIGQWGWANSVALQADGKVLVGFYISIYNVGQNLPHIWRLNADGSLDTAFNPGTGTNLQISSIAVQADGKVVIGGEFTSYNGTPRNRIARLHSNGSLDTSFNPGTGANGNVYSIAVQADGKVFISGEFSSYNGVLLDFLARLHPDGTLDTSFNPGNGLAGSVSASVASIALQADGKVLIGGAFGSYGGTPRNRLARLTNDPATQSISVPSSSRVQWLRGGAAPEVEQVSFERSADGVSWTALGAGTRITGGWERAGLSLSVTGYIRARGRTTGGQFNGSSSVIEQVASYAFPQEIVVEQPAARILLDGAASISLGSANVGNSSGSLVFTVRNVGGTDLTGLAMTRDGVNASEFNVGSLGATTLASGTSTTFIVSFTPEASGTRTATIHIASNDEDENLFDIMLTGTGVAPPGSFADWAIAFGLTGPDASPEAAPHGDGMPNLLKYAFNLDRAGPANVLVAGHGISGLPVFTLMHGGPSGYFRVEFLRRIGSGLIYTPKKSADLSPTSWLLLTDTPTVVPISADWERVIYEESYDPVATPKCFGRVEVTLP